MPVRHLVHIVPDEDVLRAIGPMPVCAIAAGLEQGDPPVPTAGVEEINPGATAAPAPALKFTLPAGRFDENAEFRRLGVYRVALYALEVRIDDDNQLPAPSVSNDKTMRARFHTLRPTAAMSLVICTGSGNSLLFQMKYL